MPIRLEDIQSPKDLKGRSVAELEALAEQLRTRIIETVSETGGHLASNLGVVELTLALHTVLNSPEDKIVWDVSHQCYTHKLLTGRQDTFGQL
ncbi:MAG: 1-deoxy-D-xylulose-5-phosphate synthase, partial [candidate division WS1 bacterium]|nr:1-deoxy-D-xylulose-5-phosphate synthase [candidate division WS1 bacterium]